MGTATNVVVGLQATNTLKVGAYGAAEVDAVDVGYIKGGVKFDHDAEKYFVKVDQQNGAIDAKTVDESLKVTLSISEATLANLAVAFGYPTTAVSSSTLSFGGLASDTMRTLYVNVNGVTSGTRKYTIWKCIPTGKTTQEYKKDGETLIDVEFEVLVDTTKTAEQRFGTIVDTGADTTPPTIAMTTPTAGGTRTAGGKTTVVLTITETNPMNENTIVYGDADNATVSIYKQGTPNTLLAGSIAYSSTAKTITFTPTENWSAGTYHVVVTTGLADQNNNHLAAQYLTYLTVS